MHASSDTTGRPLLQYRRWRSAEGAKVLLKPASTTSVFSPNEFFSARYLERSHQHIVLAGSRVSIFSNKVRQFFETLIWD